MHDTSNKLQNKTKVSIPKPEYTEDSQSKYKHRVEPINLQSSRLSEAREANKGMMTQAVQEGNYPEAPIKLAILENYIY